MPSKYDHIKALFRAVGSKNAVNILMRRSLKLSGSVSVPMFDRNVIVRPRDSDLFVIGQIFGSKEYSLGIKIENRLNEVASKFVGNGRTPVIIDAGANVGYSSIYFSETYPDAHVIGLEPDFDTFKIFERNCAGHSRITPIHAAVWNHDDGVNLQNTGADAWARTVSDRGATPSLTLRSILATVSHAEPFILKMDIEGAEKEAVAAAPEIVRSFPIIMIEPHDFLKPGGGCLSPLYGALAGQEFDTLIRGENLVFYQSEVLAPSMVI